MKKSSLKGIVSPIIHFISFKIILPTIYYFFRLKPLNNKLVLFADYLDAPLPDNFLPMVEICRQNGYECVMLSGTVYSKSLPKFTRWKNKIKYQIAFMKLFAQCKVLFLNDYFPYSSLVRPRKETQVVQLWHACGLFKRFGYASTEYWSNNSKIHNLLYPIHKNYTLACTSSAEINWGYMDAFKYDGKVVKALGIPRTDSFFNDSFIEKAKKKLLNLYPAVEGKLIILYAPTFRGNDCFSANIDEKFDYAELSKSLGDKYVFLTKFHPFMVMNTNVNEHSSDNDGFQYDISKRMSASEALSVADILITDFSSILFEYMLFEKPIISYVDDLEEYENTRGLFLPYKEIAPGPYVHNQKELVKKLLSVNDWFDIETIRQYKEKYMSACDGHSTERIFSYVFSSRN